MTWLAELDAELARAGIRGRTARRIELELADHLACDPTAEERLGSPAEIVARFVAEFGPVRTRRASYAAFLALAVAAVGLIATQEAYLAAGGWPSVGGTRGLLVGVTGLCILLAPQVAFVAGMLGIARMLRLRRAAEVFPAELRLVQRRMTVGLVAGAVTAGCLLVHAVALSGRMPWWWDGVALAGAALPLAGLSAATVSLRAAGRMTPRGGPRAAGIAADLPGRLAPFAERVAARPWLLALVVGAPACAVMLVGSAQAEGSLQEGAIRGVAEAVAFTSGFLSLGRFLGVRR